MSLPWFRFYHEWISDPKVQTMPMLWQRHLVAVFCWHASGDLKNLPDAVLAEAFGMPPEELARMKAAFKARGFISGQGWTPKNWEKRQRPSDDSGSRVAAFRERKLQQKIKDVGVGVGGVTVTSPLRNRDVTEIPLTSNSQSYSESSPEEEKPKTREGTGVTVTSPLRNRYQTVSESVTPLPDIHATDSPEAVKVCADAVRRWQGIDLDAELQATELIRCWGADLAGYGLDKAFKKLGSKERPWAYANTICRNGVKPEMNGRPSEEKPKTRAQELRDACTAKTAELKAKGILDAKGQLVEDDE
jgi:hypothetical protein